MSHAPVPDHVFLVGPANSVGDVPLSRPLGLEVVTDERPQIEASKRFKLV